MKKFEVGDKCWVNWHNRSKIDLEEYLVVKNYPYGHSVLVQARNNQQYQVSVDDCYKSKNDLIDKNLESLIHNIHRVQCVINDRENYLKEDRKEVDSLREAYLDLLSKRTEDSQ